MLNSNPKHLFLHHAILEESSIEYFKPKFPLPILHSLHYFCSISVKITLIYWHIRISISDYIRWTILQKEILSTFWWYELTKKKWRALEPRISDSIISDFHFQSCSMFDFYHTNLIRMLDCIYRKYTIKLGCHHTSHINLPFSFQFTSYLCYRF